MSNALTHPLVRAYLSSAEAEAAVLSDDRRRDLLADLREHIDRPFTSFSLMPSTNSEARVTVSEPPMSGVPFLTSSFLSQTELRGSRFSFPVVLNQTS